MFFMRTKRVLPKLPTLADCVSVNVWELRRDRGFTQQQLADATPKAPDLILPDIEKRQGDRDPLKGEGLKSLETGEWDAVIDDSGYYPRMVAASAQLLAPRVKQYLYISSISCYKEPSPIGGDEDFWVKVGIDPIRIMTSAGTFYSLRCYFDDRPIFLGRNGRISVFSSERALARYLADEHDHDLSDLSTYADIRTAATDGSLQVNITDDNVYVLTGLADDFAHGPNEVDREQLDLAVEFLRDVGDYAEENTVDDALETDQPLGQLVAYVLDPDSVREPRPPYAKTVQAYEELERFVESRLRRE